jgi:uncharacterized membrane protein
MKDAPKSPKVRCGAHRGAAMILLATSSLLLGSGESAADLKLCNASTSRIGAAIGYQDPKGWATEGWWNLSPQSCETLLKGTLPSRFIYVYAVDYDRGGEWSGSNFMCTNDKSFAIRDVRECQRRGYKRTGFFEVDTGEANDWTIRLTDPEDGRARAK